MVQAGVSSGNLSTMLSAVARNTEGILVARRAFLEALLYPFLILLIALLLGALTLLVFVPFYRQLSSVQGFEATGLPLFLSSLHAAATIGASAAGLVVLAAGVFWFLGRTVAGERILRAVPLVGRIRRHLMMARLLGALGVMLRSNVPLHRALPVALGAAGSLDLDRAAESVTALATEGRSLGEVLRAAPGVSSEVSKFLEVAERTGGAPHAAMQLADLLTDQALTESEALFVTLVPAALALAGAVVGGLLLLVVLPYMSFLESLCR
jgi:type II secretory pathway component PulF